MVSGQLIAHIASLLYNSSAIGRTSQYVSAPSILATLLDSISKGDRLDTMIGDQASSHSHYIGPANKHFLPSRSVERRTASHCFQAPDGHVQCSNTGSPTVSAKGGHGKSTNQVPVKGITVHGVVTIPGFAIPSTIIPVSSVSTFQGLVPIADSITEHFHQIQTASIVLAKNKSPSLQDIQKIIGLLAKVYPNLEQLAYKVPQINLGSLPSSEQALVKGLISALPQLLQLTETAVLTLGTLDTTVKNHNKVDMASIHKAAGLLGQSGSIPKLVTSAIKPVAAWKAPKSTTQHPKTTVKYQFYPHSSDDKLTDSKHQHTSHTSSHKHKATGTEPSQPKSTTAKKSEILEWVLMTVPGTSVKAFQQFISTLPDKGTGDQAHYEWPLRYQSYFTHMSEVQAKATNNIHIVDQMMSAKVRIRRDSRTYMDHHNSSSHRRERRQLPGFVFNQQDGSPLHLRMLSMSRALNLATLHTTMNNPALNYAYEESAGFGTAIYALDCGFNFHHSVNHL